MVSRSTIGFRDIAPASPSPSALGQDRAKARVGDRVRREAAGEAREELLSELGILGERSGRGRRLTSSKHGVAEFLRPTLLFAALTCADAQHHAR